MLAGMGLGGGEGVGEGAGEGAGRLEEEWGLGAAELEDEEFKCFRKSKSNFL